MDREGLVKKLSAYKSNFPEEESFRERFLKLLKNEADCFCRQLSHGHITGSAFIINPGADQVLLLHHRKLNRWLQPGGHADGDENVIRVAEKEAREETGLQSLRPEMPEILDLDIHTIPARGNEPEHLHYDIRFLFSANPQEKLLQNRESKALAWFGFDVAAEKSDYNESICRMIRKVKALYKEDKQETGTSREI